MGPFLRQRTAVNRWSFGSSGLETSGCGFAFGAITGLGLQNKYSMAASPSLTLPFLLGPRYDLPMKALGTHQSYWLWGPGDHSKNVFIVLGDRPERLARWRGDVQVAADLSHPWTAVWENNPVLVCRQPRVPSGISGRGSRTGSDPEEAQRSARTLAPWTSAVAET